MEGKSKRKADVVLILAAEAGHEVVGLEEADRDCVRSLPVIAAAYCCGEGVFGDRSAYAKDGSVHAVTSCTEQSMNKGVALVVTEVDLGAEHVSVNVVACTVLAVIAAIDVSGDTDLLVQVKGGSAFPPVVVDGISAVTGVEADVRISAEDVHLALSE